MEGILLVDKPADWTSFDIVNYIRRQVATAEGKKPKNVKVGHAGTLDPFATGLLIIMVGKRYTRQASDFSKLDKTYEVTMVLGSVSSTGDPEGQIEHINNLKPTETELKTALQKFTGPIMQTPPAFSAIKINGQRAYKLARAGEEVIIEPRPVTIYKLDLISYAYPEVKFTAKVSSGTYIRSLVDDLGRELKSAAYTLELRRTSIGTHDVKDARPVDKIAITE